MNAQEWLWNIPNKVEGWNGYMAAGALVASLLMIAALARDGRRNLLSFGRLLYTLGLLAIAYRSVNSGFQEFALLFYVASGLLLGFITVTRWCERDKPVWWLLCLAKDFLGAMVTFVCGPRDHYGRPFDRE